MSGIQYSRAGRTTLSTAVTGEFSLSNVNDSHVKSDRLFSQNALQSRTTPQ